MKAWTTESLQFDPERHPPHEFIVEDKEDKIKEFLKYGNEDQKWFLVGSKGQGKTLLMRYKSWLYRKRAPGIRYGSETELIESLSLQFKDLSGDELRRYTEWKHWREIWNFAILYYLLINFSRTAVNPTLTRKLGNAKRLSPILQHILLNKQDYNQLISYSGEMQGQMCEEVQSGVTVFIDNVDQEIYQLVSEGRYLRAGGGGYDTATKIWANAQIGLMLAIYNIWKSNQHVRLFASIRSEAFQHMSETHGQYINILEYATELDYSKNDLKRIFERNIELTEPHLLANPGEADPIARFLGFNEMAHPIAKHPDGRPKTEGAFDFFYRHTYGRPREIVMLGKYVQNELLILKEDYRELPLAEKVNRVREVVNRVSHDKIWGSYRADVIPQFEERHLETLLKSIRCNQISKSELHLVDGEAVNYFWRLGLLGRVKPKARGLAHFQDFVRPAEYNYSRNKELDRSSRYYFIHSTLDTAFRESEDHEYRTYHNPSNIVGQGNEFEFPNHPADFYTPNHRGLRHNQNFEELHLSAYFKGFFDTSDPEYVTLREAYPSEALVQLNLIARCHLMDRMAAAGLGDRYAAWRGHAKDRLKDCQTAQYQTRLGDTNLATMKLFSNRLRGRLVVLGCYLFLDLPVEIIHRYIVEHIIDFEEKGVNANHAKYLQTCFFIEKLTGDGDSKAVKPSSPDKAVAPAGKPGRPRHRDKAVIFGLLSQHEQELLRLWFHILVGYVKHPAESWVDPAHHVWLNENLLSHLWRPPFPKKP